MQFIEVLINCPDKETARKIADTLLRQGLIACANIYPEIESSYHWNGDIEHAMEIPLLVKTRESLFRNVCDRVEELHPYDIPSITALPLTLLNTAYARWLEEETSNTPD